jgi:hypothetical protein
MRPAAPAALARAKGASRRGGDRGSVAKRPRAELADAAQAEKVMPGDEVSVSLWWLYPFVHTLSSPSFDQAARAT